jgi:hypothetical protein
MLWKFGYDPVAFPLQIALTWAVLLFCYAFTDPKRTSIGCSAPARSRRRKSRGCTIFAILMVFIPLCVMTPTHFILLWLFGPGS